MLLVGLILYGFMRGSAAGFGQPNHYYVQGVGYATILDILRGDLGAVGFLLLLAVAKLLVTCLTLGSGASGGIFSPSLFLGATLGGCFGSALNFVFPHLDACPAHFAYAGMAAMVGGTTGAALTATVMVFEMTRAYSLILPVILTVVLANVVRSLLSEQTIYTLKLKRRGHIVPQGLQAWRGGQRAADVMSPDFVLVAEDLARDESAIRPALLRGQVVVLIGPEGQIRAVIDRAFNRQASDTKLAAQLTPYVIVQPAHRLDEVLQILDQNEARVALVSRGGSSTGKAEVLGVITERQIAGVACAAADLLE
jgi:CIC family chloride channel protein